MRLAYLTIGLVLASCGDGAQASYDRDKAAQAAQDAERAIQAEGQASTTPPVTLNECDPQVPPQRGAGTYDAYLFAVECVEDDGANDKIYTATVHWHVPDFTVVRTLKTEISEPVAAKTMSFVRNAHHSVSFTYSTKTQKMKAMITADGVKTGPFDFSIDPNDFDVNSNLAPLEFDDADNANYYREKVTVKFRGFEPAFMLRELK